MEIETRPSRFPPYRSLLEYCCKILNLDIKKYFSVETLKSYFAGSLTLKSPKVLIQVCSYLSLKSEPPFLKYCIIR